jgi:hypothetical protein
MSANIDRLSEWRARPISAPRGGTMRYWSVTALAGVAVKAFAAVEREIAKLRTTR